MDFLDDLRPLFFGLCVVAQSTGVDFFSLSLTEIKVQKFAFRVYFRWIILPLSTKNGRYINFTKIKDEGWEASIALNQTRFVINWVILPKGVKGRHKWS